MGATCSRMRRSVRWSTLRRVRRGAPSFIAVRCKCCKRRLHLPAVLAYHALAAGLAEPAFHFSLAAGDEAMRLLAVRDAITFYEQARHLLIEPVQGLSLEAMLAAPEIEHLYTHLGRAYELNAEWEKARTAYTSMLAYAQDARQQVMESAALNRLAALAAQ